MADQQLIRGLDGLTARDRPAVGGKAASLGELTGAGLRVPAGFVVTSAAFDRGLAALDPAWQIRSEIERLHGAGEAAIADVTARIRERITTRPLPGGVRDAITAGYLALRPDGAAAPATAAATGAGQTGAAAESGIAVAVRSSATSEDSAEASFAGLADTYLWVRGASAVADRVRACWASLYNAEAVTYRLRHGIGEQDLAMAVVVQVMVEPRCAGVMFTCSPVSGDRSVIAIEGTWGLGSVLVGGEVTPDSFMVSKVTGEVLRRTIGPKHRQHLPDPAGAGVIAGDVPAELREQPCLTDGEIAGLAEVGRQVERHYGRTQDIEWAIDDAGIAALQSRDETVWSARRAAPIATAKVRAVDHVFENLSRVKPVTMPER